MRQGDDMSGNAIMWRSKKGQEIIAYLRKELNIPDRFKRLEITIDIHDPIIVSVTYMPKDNK